MNMSYYDKIQAIIRNPDYVKKYKALYPSTPLSLEMILDHTHYLKRKAFLKKWGLAFPIDPVQIRKVSKEVEGGVFIDYAEEVRLIDLQNKRYLTLRIDLKADKIVKVVSDYIRAYQQLLPKSNSMKPERQRKTTLDPFEIYDLKHDEKLTLLGIAKKIYGFKENPSYSEKAKAYYERVKYAYEKACQMINQVSPG